MNTDKDRLWLKLYRTRGDPNEPTKYERTLKLFDWAGDDGLNQQAVRDALADGSSIGSINARLSRLWKRGFLERLGGGYYRRAKR